MFHYPRAPVAISDETSDRLPILWRFADRSCKPMPTVTTSDNSSYSNCHKCTSLWTRERNTKNQLQVQSGSSEFQDYLFVQTFVVVCVLEMQRSSVHHLKIVILCTEIRTQPTPAFSMMRNMSTEHDAYGMLVSFPAEVNMSEPLQDESIVIR